MQQEQIKTVFKEGLSELFSLRLEAILEERGISGDNVSSGAISGVIEKQYDSSVDDFLNDTKEVIDENNYRDVVNEYLQENFDSDFVTVKIEEDSNINLEEHTASFKHKVGREQIRNECYRVIEDYKNLRRATDTFIEAYNQTMMNFDSKIVEVYELIISHNYGEINLEILDKLRTSDFDGYFRSCKLSIRGYSDYFLVDIQFFQSKEENELAQMARQCSLLYTTYLSDLDDLNLRSIGYFN
ncbi:hypothetical protein [Lactococcus lactis]|uniref:hypothetical protein n=1 Tax=Lactococcus lactis TaxID=1358 RepID=UPI00223B93AA|nr:hypothetical protein [Lactococcus lactis]MCT0449320.1 hypothetical protein [Lactococcus lactis subsp. lactis]